MIVIGPDAALGELNSLWINEGGAPKLLDWSGAIDIKVDGYTRVVFCVDLLTSITYGAYSTTMDFSDTLHAGDYSSVPYLQRAGWLLQNEFPTTAGTLAASQRAGAAFQLAIWDIVTDKGDGFDKGTVAKSTTTGQSTDPFVLAAAIQYEADSALYSSAAGIVYHNTLSGTPAQTLMGRSAADGGPSPTPEPAALILTLSGLALIGLSRLRGFRRR
jgi:hypothetical protein